MLAKPDVLDTESIRELDLLQGLGHSPLTRNVLMPSNYVEHSKSHDWLLWQVGDWIIPDSRREICDRLGRGNCRNW